MQNSAKLDLSCYNNDDFLWLLLWLNVISDHDVFVKVNFEKKSDIRRVLQFQVRKKQIKIVNIYTFWRKPGVKFELVL